MTSVRITPMVTYDEISSQTVLTEIVEPNTDALSFIAGQILLENREKSATDSSVTTWLNNFG